MVRRESQEAVEKSAVKVSYVGLVQNVVGTSCEMVELTGSTRAGDLLALLEHRHGESFRYSVLRSDGQLRSTCRVLIGDQDIRRLKGMDTIIEPGSGVAIVVMVYPVEGG